MRSAAMLGVFALTFVVAWIAIMLGFMAFLDVTGIRDINGGMTMGVGAVFAPLIALTVAFVAASRVSSIIDRRAARKSGQ